MIAAEARLEVAERELMAAQADAAAKLTVAEADRKVVEAQTKAAADVLRQEVAAYGGDADYVRAKLYEKAAPGLKSVVTSDSPGEIFGLPIREKTTSVQQQDGRAERPRPAAVQQPTKGGAK